MADSGHVAAPLLLMGRKFPLDFAGGGLVVNGVPLKISERFNTGEGTGLNVWDGSVVLAKALEHGAGGVLRGTTILEVGCGTGVVGLAAGAMGAHHVYLTDLEYALDNTRKAVDLNKEHIDAEFHIQELDWTKPVWDTPVDLVLAADVVWVEELIEPLVHALVAVTEGIGNAPRPDVLMAHQMRSTRSDELLFSLLEPHFAVEALAAGSLHPDFQDSAITVYRLRRMDKSSNQDSQTGQ